MPRFTERFQPSTPKYRKHRASGQAIVTLNGKDHYLGPYGTIASKNEYDRVTGEWLTAGRTTPAVESDTTIVELLAAFRRFAVVYYRKNGKPTGELSNIKHAIKPLHRLYGREPVTGFGPLKLKAIQRGMVAEGLCRTTINARIGIIKRIFAWGVSEELCPRGLAHALRTVRGLQAGRCQAREPEPVKPVTDADIEATLPHLPPIVADMVRLQRLTGARPGEICAMRPRDIDRTSEVWVYQPESHKTQHHGRERVIFIGPKGQDVLRPYLLRNTDDCCFRPVDSERKRKAAMRAIRKTPVQPSQADRSKRSPQVKPGQSYSKDAYTRAIRRGCDKAKIPRWAPNRIRHTAGTEIRKRFGLEGAQVCLGHSRADITQIYAQRDLGLAARIMREVG